MMIDNDNYDDVDNDIDDDDVDDNETDNQTGLWLVPMLRCHPEHVSLVTCHKYSAVTNRVTDTQYDIAAHYRCHK